MSEPTDICPELKLYFTWLCCLHPIEAVPMQLCIYTRVTLFNEFILKDAFDAAWAATGDPIDSPRYKNFVFVYYLDLRVIEYEGSEVEVYWFIDPFWFKMLLYAGCPSFDCPDGCFEREYSLG